MDYGLRLTRFNAVTKTKENLLKEKDNKKLSVFFSTSARRKLGPFVQS